jgi:hypothetical protein
MAGGTLAIAGIVVANVALWTVFAIVLTTPHEASRDWPAPLHGDQPRLPDEFEFLHDRGDAL